MESNISKESTSNKRREIRIKLKECLVSRYQTIRDKRSTSKQKSASKANIEIKIKPQKSTRLIAIKCKESVNTNNDYAIKKFEKEFARCIEKLGIHNKKDQEIDFSVMKQILKLMGFGQDEVLSTKFFKYSNKINKIHVNKLKEMIAGMMNISLNGKSSVEVKGIHKEYKQLKASLNKSCLSERKQNVKRRLRRNEIERNKLTTCTPISYSRNTYSRDRLMSKTYKRNVSSEKEMKEVIGDLHSKDNLAKTVIDISQLIESRKNIHPLLTIEVNIGNKVEVIPVNEGDTARKLAKRFAEKNGITLYKP